jgi:hypothetical protein
MLRFYILTALFCTCAAAYAAGVTPASRLIGTWQSNRQLTVATLKNLSKMEPRAKARIEALFGKMQIRFEAKRFSSRLPDESGKAEWQNYDIVKEEDETVWIGFMDTLTNERSIRRITFKGTNRCWIELNEELGTREYFDRISDSSEANQALQHNDPSCHVSCLRTPRASRGRG